jgi:hypothetical protein
MTGTLYSGDPVAEIRCIQSPEYFCLDCWRIHPARSVLVHYDHAEPEDSCEGAP